MKAVAPLEDVPLQVPGHIEFDIDAKELRRLISAVAVSYPTQPIMDVTRHIVVEAETGRLKLTSTNLSTFSTASTGKVTIKESGRVGLFGNQLLRMRGPLAQETIVSVKVSDSVAHFSTPTSHWGFRLNDLRMFPKTPDVVDEMFGTALDRVKFIEAVEAVHRAAATDLIRHSLMIVDVTDQTIRASDGTRYQQVYTPWWPKGLDVGIPSGAVSRVLQFCKRAESEMISFRASDQYLGFLTEEDAFLVAKPAAKFAMMDDLILKPALVSCVQAFGVDLGEFASALSRVTVVSDQATNVVSLEIGDVTAKVSTEDRMGNSASKLVPLKSSDLPEPRTLVFNLKYLTDMLAMCGNDADGIFFIGPDKKTKKTPLLYRGVSKGIIGVLNQMRLT